MTEPKFLPQVHPIKVGRVEGEAVNSTGGAKCLCSDTLCSDKALIHRRQEHPNLFHCERTLVMEIRNILLMTQV
jgi:hypothetical protein